ncbi:MAG: HD domain-containing protein [Bacteroidota bacterium]
MLDITLFSAFLAINLIVGLFHSRQIATMRDYSVGRKDFSTATLTSTVIATYIGGGFLFRHLEQTYTQGLYYIIPATVGGTGYLLLVGRILTLRMGEFLDALSIAEAMGKLYGRTVRVITGVSGVLREVVIVSLQFVAMGKAVKLVFDPAGITLNVLGHTVEVGGVEMGIITVAPIITLYAAFGGIRAVTFTDLLQFMTFFVFIPILTLIVWNHLKDPDKVVHVLTTNPNFSFEHVLQWNWKTLSMLGLMLHFSTPSLLPTTFQRIVMARNVYQARRSFTYAADLRLIAFLFLTVAGILLLADNPTLDPKSLVDYLINRYSYPGLKGLTAVGIVAMAMSTADSLLNSAAVLAVNDIIRPLQRGFKESIALIRVSSLLVGAFALCLALVVQDLLQLVLLAGSFFMPIVTIPSLLAVLGFRSSARAVLIGMLAGFAVTATWYFRFGNMLLPSTIPGMAANLLFFMGSHYLLREKGGWVGIQEPAPLLAEREKAQLARKALIENLRKPRLYAYLKKNLPAQGGLYSLFGVYVIGATYALFFTIPAPVVTAYPKLCDFIINSVLIMVVIFTTYPAWPPILRDKRFIAFFWPLGIGYLLFFVGTILVLMSGYNEVQVMIFMLNLIIATLLLSGPLVIGLAASGVILACTVWYLQTGLIPIAAEVPLRFKRIYTLLLFSSCWIALIRFRQASSRLEEQKKYFRTTGRGLRAKLIETLGYRREILKELNKDELAFLDSTALTYMKQAIYRVTDYLRLEVSEVKLEQLLAEARELLKLQDFESPPQLITKWHTNYATLQVDVPKIKQLLVESIVYIQEKNSTNRPITIGLEPAKLGHKLESMPNYISKLAALKMTITTSKVLPPTEEIYMLNPMQTASYEPAEVTDPELLENIRIIDAHYGYVDVSQATTHIYVIPTNVREVRGKVMELLRTPAAADPEETTHPLAVQLEQELMDKLAGTPVDLAVIRRALNTIKKYHGGVSRKSGEPFFTHPLATAVILTDYSQDQDAIVAALLHDTVEDTSLSLAQVRAMFGETVALLVSKATNLEDKIRKVKLQAHEYKHRLVNSGDPRATLIKLSDRLHNMRTIGGHPSLAKQKKIAEETLTFFVPVAKQLDLAAMVAELEQLSLKILEK